MRRNGGRLVPWLRLPRPATSALAHQASRRLQSGIFGKA